MNVLFCLLIYKKVIMDKKLNFSVVESTKDFAIVETGALEYFIVLRSKECKRMLIMKKITPEAMFRDIEVYRVSNLKTAYSFVRRGKEKSQRIRRLFVDLGVTPYVFVLNGAVVFVGKKLVRKTCVLEDEAFSLDTVLAFDANSGESLRADFGKWIYCNHIFVNSKGNLVCVAGIEEKQFAVVDGCLCEVPFSKNDGLEHFQYGWEYPKKLGFDEDEIVSVFE